MKDRKLTAPEMGRLTVEEYRSRPGSGIVVVLDNVRSAYNVGSAFRSADAFGADRVVLCGICATPPSAEIHKTALGAELSVPWEHFPSTLEAVAALREEGYTVVSVEQTEHSVKLTGCGAMNPAVPGTKYAYAGGGLEYFPLGRDGIRLHAVYYRDNAKHRNNFDFGVTWKIDIIKH